MSEGQDRHLATGCPKDSKEYKDLMAQGAASFNEAAGIFGGSHITRSLGHKYVERILRKRLTSPEAIEAILPRFQAKPRDFEATLANWIIPVYVKRPGTGWESLRALISPCFWENIILDHVGKDFQSVDTSVEYYDGPISRPIRSLPCFGYRNDEPAAGYTQLDNDKIMAVRKILISVDSNLLLSFNTRSIPPGPSVQYKHVHIVNRSGIENSNYWRTARTQKNASTHERETDIRGWDLILGYESWAELMPKHAPDTCVVTTWPDPVKPEDANTLQDRVDWDITKHFRTEEEELMLPTLPVRKRAGNFVSGLDAPDSEVYQRFPTPTLDNVRYGTATPVAPSHLRNLIIPIQARNEDGDQIWSRNRRRGPRDLRALLAPACSVNIMIDTELEEKLGRISRTTEPDEPCHGFVENSYPNRHMSLDRSYFSYPHVIELFDLPSRSRDPETGLRSSESMRLEIQRIHLTALRHITWSRSARTGGDLREIRMDALGADESKGWDIVIGGAAAEKIISSLPVSEEEKKEQKEEREEDCHVRVHVQPFHACGHQWGRQLRTWE